MNLHCCHQRLPIAVEHGLVDDSGRPALGLFRPSGLQIVIDIATPRNQRRHVLFHELAHAFDHLLGRVDPADIEGQANRAAMMEGQFAYDLECQGGERAIHSLFGDEDLVIDADTPAPADRAIVIEDQESEFPTDIACCRCHQPYPSSAVRTGHPIYHPKIDAYAVWRTLVCADCNIEMRWQQMATYQGLPLPKTIVAPVARPLGMSQ